MRDQLRNLVVNDYFTPNIKAEVILDALLTPYIADIVREQCGVGAVFVTKEMSVFDTEQSEKNPTYGNMGTKIDYILANEEAVYLVELKTTDGSIEKEQVERYLKNCQGKTFGAVFGDKLLRIMARKTGVPLEDDKKPEKQLRTLFDGILRKYGVPKAENASCAERAKNLLKQKNWASTYKYLYTMGRLLDYLDDFPERTLWNLPLRLLYITPTGKQPHPELEKYPAFYLRAKETDSVSLWEAAEYLCERDELAKLLADIIIEIYGK